MIVEQIHWDKKNGWSDEISQPSKIQPQLVFCFGGKNALQDPQKWLDIYKKYPNSAIVSCSTSGEIHDTIVSDESISLSALEFSEARVQAKIISLKTVRDRYEAGLGLGKQLAGEDLRLILVLSDGKNVNGSELVRGFNDAGNGVPITGGLAGDGDRFESTLVGLNSMPEEDNVVAIGIYGKGIKVGFGSMGGWDTFGPVRRVTKSNGNILYRIDDQPALELYKKYLGEFARDLPGSGLRFPLCIHGENGEKDLIRTIVGINEEEGSLIFAGDIPQEASAQLMKANFGRLVDGAVGAAGQSLESFGNIEPDFALLISCVGRKLVLGQQTEDEVEEVREVLGKKPAMAGFYSYGEISPASGLINCQLHNQTMTITTLAEV